MTVVLVDNYDSFTYNLYHLVCSTIADDVVVLVNDDVEGWARLSAAGVSAVVVSPGPGRPDVERDFGISADALRSGVPVLGVCLGHQGLGLLEGGRVRRALEPFHGRVSRVEHDASRLFRDVPSGFEAVRYHSLLVDEVPDSLRVTAWTDGSSGERVVMALEHKHRAAFGVQFHPESIKSTYGAEIVRNFFTAVGLPVVPSFQASLGCDPRPAAVPAGGWSVVRRSLAVEPDTSRLFERHFSKASHAFWLDSSSATTAGARFSMLGSPGPYSEIVTSDAGRGVDVRRPDGQVEHVAGDVFAYLERQLHARHLPAVPGLPTEFNLGYVGYLGYELKAECGGAAAHRTESPDAAFVLADRAIVVDHVDGVAWALALVPDHDHAAGEGWFDEIASVVQACVALPRAPASALPAPRDVGPRAPLAARDTPEHYAELVTQCQAEIAAGETYEVCLTTMFDTERPADSGAAYRHLRDLSPVPFGAFLRFDDVEVLSASPERFLSVDGAGAIEAKPIKGTRRRGRNAHEDVAIVEELRNCEKDRSENLMIVDLLRNDLGSVSQLGSVHVPVIFDVETYATVHQLVSTVRARLRPDVSPVRCVQAAFPGGSMTGAPKRRTMEIIDRLEGGARGVYSGALGYFALSGAVDLSIVIRTIVLTGDRAYVGAGGAVVALSDPAAEVAEMQLKAQAPLDAVRAQATAGTHVAGGRLAS